MLALSDSSGGASIFYPGIITLSFYRDRKEGLLMAKGIFNKNEAPNKRQVQDIIYGQISKIFGERTWPTTIVMLPGSNPEPALRLYKKHFYKPIIHAYEKDFGLFYDLKEKTPSFKEFIDFRLNRKDVKDAHDGMSIEDLDFCTNLFADRRRRIPELSYKDTFTILRRRLAMRVTSTASINHHKAFMFSVSLRNGLGKTNTVACLESLIYLTGHKIYEIDGIDTEDPRGYGKGHIVEGPGCLHKNGNTYHIYEHKISVLNPGDDLFSKRELKVKMFTYTDGTPMLTFVMTFI